MAADPTRGPRKPLEVKPPRVGAEYYPRRPAPSVGASAGPDWRGGTTSGQSWRGSAGVDPSRAPPAPPIVRPTGGMGAGPSMGGAFAAPTVSPLDPGNSVFSGIADYADVFGPRSAAAPTPTTPQEMVGSEMGGGVARAAERIRALLGRR